MAEVEKDTCDNCSSELNGVYCSFCGQKHHPHKETFGELVYEFFSDFTHFDSRFFRTVIPLLIKPGGLTVRYINGKHASQFHPIRLYLFSSFFYFLLFFGCGKMEPEFNRKSDDPNPQIDSLRVDSLINEKPDNRTVIARRKIGDNNTQFTIASNKVIDSLIAGGVTPEQYMKSQDTLPASQRDNFFVRHAIKKMLKLYYEGQKDGEGLINKIFSSVLHNIPKMLFFLLPLFALLLKLLYVRRKQFYYVDHAVFSLHYFSFIFILLILFQFLLEPIFNAGWLMPVAFTWMLLYLFLAMKRIYGQGFFKTLLKYVLLGFSFNILLIIAFLVNLLISAGMA